MKKLLKLTGITIALTAIGVAMRTNALKKQLKKTNENVKKHLEEISF